MKTQNSFGVNQYYNFCIYPFRTLDWSSMQLAAPLYTLFLGTDALATQKEVKPEMKRVPASTRIRLKLLQYLCRVTKAGFIIPPCIQVHKCIQIH